MKTILHSLKLIVSMAFLGSLMVSGYAQQKYTSRTQLGTTYKGSIQPLKSLVSQGGDCSAVAPENWIVSGVSPKGNALDLIRSDKSMYAGYLNVGVQGGKAYYNKDFTSPQAFIQTTISEGGKLKVTWGQPLQDKLGLTILPFGLIDPNDPHQSKGVVFYSVNRVLGDIIGYIIEMYTAQTYKDIWESQGAEAIAVALSIRCTGNMNISDKPSYRRIEANKIESFYISELGMAYAHDAATGENFWVNPLSDRNDQGSQGPGYYRKSGNEMKKLLPGRK